jgi:hypothetical protein
MKVPDNHFVKDVNDKAMSGPKLAKKFIFVLQCFPDGKNFSK